MTTNIEEKWSEKDLVELFRSGNFTIVYWDRGEPTIYKGRWNYHKENEKDEYEKMEKSRIYYPMYDIDGYCPDIIHLLVKALGGKADSI